MVIEKTKNAARNVFWGVTNKALRLVAQFAVRAIIIRTLGEAFLGLDSLFTSVLSMLSLAELGIGTALVFNMYKAIAEDDGERICALMLFYKKCYRVIGFIILGVGLVLLPFVPYLVGEGLPDGVNVYILYLINLAGVVSTYFLFAYKNCLLDAFQRNDLSSKIEILCGVLQYGAQIALLVILKDYYVYLTVVPCVKILQNCFTAIVVGRRYSQFRPFGALSKEYKKQIFTKVKALITYKIGNVVSNSVDNIVISVFLGLAVLAKYGNYYYVITTLFTLLQIYYNAITAGIGNSVVVSSVGDNYKNFKTLMLMQAWICGFCAVGLLTIYQDFITLWMGKDMLFETGVVFCLVAYFYCWKIQDVVYIHKDALGMWEKDKWRPLVSAGCNLVLNITSVRFIGIYGIILSTMICCLFIDLPWGTSVLFKNYFKVKTSAYYVRLLLYTLFNAAVCALCFFICGLIRTEGAVWYSVLMIIVKGIICFAIYNIAFFITFFRTTEFRTVARKVKNLLFKGRAK